MNKAVRYVVGLIACAVAPILFVPELYRLVQTGDCGGGGGGGGEQACPAGTATHVWVLVLAMLVLVVGAILTLGVGVLLSAVLGGVEVLADGSGTSAHILGPALIGVPILLAVLGVLATIGSNKRRAELAQFKARATQVPGTIVSITDTGVLINDDPRVEIAVQYPDGSGGTARIERKMVVSRVSLPRVGDPANVWYDPSGAQKPVFELADLAAAHAAAGPGSVADATPEPVSGLTASLERLSALHREGALTDDEFTTAKRRLLGT